MNPTFNTKEEYLTWRTQWRARYAELSQEIRDLKLARRATVSLRHVSAEAGNTRWANVIDRVKATEKKYANASTGEFMWWKVMAFQKEARCMMEWRKESKLRAQELYLKSKQAMPV